MSETPQKLSNLTTKKVPMSDEERLELANKLDRELEDFINNLPKRKHKDGSEEEWEKDLENHPFFMKSLPKDGSELHPLYEGLQQLKYDPDENSPEELAVSYKDDGNFNFKHKNYRLAVLSYTEGIKIKCTNTDLNASLLNNRSAANYFLKNYRSSLTDSVAALKLNPGHLKAKTRAANCCFYLNRYDQCLEYCEDILKKINDNQKLEIEELRKRCIEGKKIYERDERRKKIIDNKKIEAEKKLLNAIKSRGIKFDSLEVEIPALSEHKVHLDDCGMNLIWPVVFLYPEFEIMDFVQEFSEDETFSHHLEEMFKSPPEWDTKNQYKPENLNIYFKSSTNKPQLVNTNTTLKNVIMDPLFIVYSGVPTFMVLVKNSSTETEFLGWKAVM